MEGDEAGIVATVHDYFEGWFDGDVARMRRALHPDLAKRRFGADVVELRTTTTERMLELTAGGEGKENAADRRIDIHVADVYGDIGSAVVHTAVYHEYLHLVRTGEGWKIANALWQPS
jgi:hypothetical protein